MLSKFFLVVLLAYCARSQLLDFRLSLDPASKLIASPSGGRVSNITLKLEQLVTLQLPGSDRVSDWWKPIEWSRINTTLRFNGVRLSIVLIHVDMDHYVHFSDQNLVISEEDKANGRINMSLVLPRNGTWIVGVSFVYYYGQTIRMWDVSTHFNFSQWEADSPYIETYVPKHDQDKEERKNVRLFDIYLVNQEVIGQDWNSTSMTNPKILSFNNSFATYYENETTFQINFHAKDNKNSVEKNKFFVFQGSCNEFIMNINFKVQNENETKYVPMEHLVPYWASAGVIFAVEAVWPWEIIQRPAIETKYDEVLQEYCSSVASPPSAAFGPEVVGFVPLSQNTTYAVFLKLNINFEKIVVARFKYNNFVPTKPNEEEEFVKILEWALIIGCGALFVIFVFQV